LAKSGDQSRLKEDERKYIFQNIKKVALVKKKGNTLKYWYDYIAVFSGSYIYFYPAQDYNLIENIIKMVSKTDISLSSG
jgi:hypothetical protein